MIKYIDHLFKTAHRNNSLIVIEFNVVTSNDAILQNLCRPHKVYQTFPINHISSIKKFPNKQEIYSPLADVGLFVSWSPIGSSKMFLSSDRLTPQQTDLALTWCHHLHGLPSSLSVLLTERLTTSRHILCDGELVSGAFSDCLSEWKPLYRRYICTVFLRYASSYESAVHSFG